jgi:hypothetical protein
MSEMYISGTATHDRLRSGEIAATASTVLRYAVLVALATFLILGMLPVVLAAAGPPAGAPF